MGWSRWERIARTRAGAGAANFRDFGIPSTTWTGGTLVRPAGITPGRTASAAERMPPSSIVPSPAWRGGHGNPAKLHFAGYECEHVLVLPPAVEPRDDPADLRRHAGRGLARAGEGLIGLAVVVQTPGPPMHGGRWNCQV